MKRMVKRQDGTEALYVPVACPDKHLLLTYDLDEDIFKGIIVEGRTIDDLHEVYLSDRTKSYARSAIRWALRWLQQHKVRLPQSLAREL